MKNMKRIILLTVLCLSVLGACKKTNNETKIEKEAIDTTVDNTLSKEVTPEAIKEEGKDKTVIKVAALKGPTSMGMVQIMDASEKGEYINQYDFTIAGAPDEITAGLIKGDFDAAAIPCNLAAVLYNKTKGKIVTAGINTLGVLYIVEAGDSIHSPKDLKGKTIYTTGKGTTPEYTLYYLLSSYGLTVGKDVKVEFKTEASEVASLLSESKEAIAMLPQPFVTTAMLNNDKLRIALDITKEWENISTNKSSVVTGVVVFNKEFLKNNKEAANAFITEYEASTDFVANNIEEAANLIEKYGIIKAAVAKKALPYCNITFIQGEEMQEKIEGYLDTLYNQNPATIGGKLPDDDFYYKK